MSATLQLPPLLSNAALVREPELGLPASGDAGRTDDFAGLMDLLQVLSQGAALPGAAAPVAPAIPGVDVNPSTTPAAESSSTGLSASVPHLAALPRLAVTEIAAASPNLESADPESPETLGKADPAALTSPVQSSKEELLGVASAPPRAALQHVASAALQQEVASRRAPELPSAQRARPNARTSQTSRTEGASVSPERALLATPSPPQALREAVAASDVAGSTTAERQTREAPPSQQPIERKAAELFVQPRESAPAVQSSDSVTQSALVHATRSGVESTPRPPEAPAPVAIAERVAWLATRGGGSARVVLHPAELGEVEISVRVRGDRVEVAIQTEMASTRSALVGSRDALSDSFAARELRIESLDVRVAEPRPFAGSDGNSLGSSGRDTSFDNTHTNRGSQQQGNADDGEKGRPAQNGSPAVTRFHESAEGVRTRAGQLDLHA